MAGKSLFSNISRTSRRNFAKFSEVGLPIQPDYATSSLTLSPILGRGYGPPKLGVTPPKSPTSGFPGSKFSPPSAVHVSAYKNRMSNSRILGVLWPPYLKNCQNCGTSSSISTRQIWPKFAQNTLQGCFCVKIGDGKNPETGC